MPSQTLPRAKKKTTLLFGRAEGHFQREVRGIWNRRRRRRRRRASGRRRNGFPTVTTFALNALSKRWRPSGAHTFTSRLDEANVSIFAALIIPICRGSSSSVTFVRGRSLLREPAKSERKRWKPHTRSKNRSSATKEEEEEYQEEELNERRLAACRHITS